MGLANQFGTKEEQELKRDYRYKDIEAVERERANLNRPKEAQENPDIETSGFAIATSWLKSGYNNLRASLTDDPNVRKEFEEKERINSETRRIMREKYTLTQAFNEIDTVLTVVAGATLIATGVGAAGGLALLGRAALKQTAYQGFKYVRDKGLTRAAIDITEEIAKTPEARAQAASTVAKLEGMLTSNSFITRNVGAPLAATLQIAKPQIRKAGVAGLVSAGVISTAIGNDVLQRAHHSVENNNQIKDEVIRNRNKSTREILDERNQNKFGPSHININRQKEEINQEINNRLKNSQPNPRKLENREEAKQGDGEIASIAVQAALTGLKNSSANLNRSNENNSILSKLIENQKSMVEAANKEEPTNRIGGLKA